jgi:uncharacterized membrane protein
MKRIKQPRQHRLLRYLHSFNFAGTVLGMILVFLGFFPSLLPRGWVLQGVLSGILFTIGYAFGLIISHFYRRFKPKELTLAQKSELRKYTFAILVVVYVVFVIVGFNWQQDVRKLIGQDPEHSIAIIGNVLVTLLIVAFILLIARSIRTLFGWLKKKTDKHIPKPISYTAAWIITVLLCIGLLNGVILSGSMNVLNKAYGTKNDTTAEGIVQPTSQQLSGGTNSLISWDSLGRQGRSFIGKAPTTDQLTKFNAAPAMQPIRVYAGLKSADSTQARADLAVADLKRAGGFDRKIIEVVTTTGTGWVDEEGAKPLEYMYNGDSAVVSMQYSYLPSSLSFLVDQQKAKDAGNQLYNAVYNQVLNMPAEQRPKIVVFGESLGSFGGEAAFANLSAFKATSDGAVWAGPPNFNILRKTATTNRDSGSTEIKPVFQQGQNLRFVVKPPDLNSPSKPWGQPRAVYLENSSDPIVWWSPNLLLHKPDWLKEPRGNDVSKNTHWFPFVTFWGVSGDMLFSTGVPDGHGHKYGTHPTDAWSYVAPPTGWTPQKTQALKAELGG